MERVCLEDWPGGPMSIAVRGPAGAVQFYPGRPVSLHWHRPPQAGRPLSDCPLLPGGTCTEEMAASAAAVLAADVGEAAQRGSEDAYQRLEELYRAMEKEG